LLTFVGLGLWDEKDISIRGLDAVKSADKIFAEFYTSRLMGLNQKALEKMARKDITVLDRAQVEEGFEKIVLSEAKNKNVCFLVGGDPLVATTHADLIIRAKKAGIKTRVIHNSSIYSAVAESGLQAYRFGKSTTIVFWTEKFKPASFYEVIARNLGGNLHTLCFLDIDSEKGKFMEPREAMDVLLKMEFLP
jgi:diphthine synthase